MRVWRLCKQRDLATAFGSIGAELYGGRWNHKGGRVVYAATSLSLASLEVFVHLEPAFMPRDLCSIVATVPDSASIEQLTPADLPENWRDYPAPAVLQDIGSSWLRERRSLALVVPSAVNPDENNVLLNPLHTQFSMIADLASKPFHFDPRMWK